MLAEVFIKRPCLARHNVVLPYTFNDQVREDSNVIAYGFVEKDWMQVIEVLL
jgi:hypothetical protein